MDPESIRRFLNLYEQYVNEAQASYSHISDSASIKEASRPVDLKLCEYIVSLISEIALNLIQVVSGNDTLDNRIIRAHIGKEES